MFCVVTRPAGDGHRFPHIRVNKVLMTPPASTVNEASPFELGNELPYLGRQRFILGLFSLHQPH